ncbi:hypothetical protein NST63_20230 [Heyndrickxia sp. FSL W8-0496]|jgi:hypothetical protein|uniref:hypothetical protein n=1 Tax=Heyndrickxia TaxID=2837504 RepID=UPI0030F51C2D
MRGMSKFFSLWKIFISILILIIFGLLSTMYFLYNNNFITKILTINQADVDSLVNTIWQIHAAIATLTIALMALLVGFNNDKKFGINTLEYILVIRKEFFKYQDEIILSIFLILIQYFFVAYQALAGVVIIFSFNILIICHMAYTSIRLTLGDSEVSKEIKNYLIAEIKIAIKHENEEIENGRK